MLPTEITNMLAALEKRSGEGPRADRLTRFGRAVVDAPELAARLLDEMADMDMASPRDDGMVRLLGAALDEARMARENGQARGTAFISAVEEHLGRLVRTDRLSFRGRLALSRSWLQAGLAPPESLASGQDHLDRSAFAPGDRTTRPTSERCSTASSAP